MDLFPKLGSTENPEKHNQTSTSDLFSSAKLLADAAKTSFGGESHKVDKGKLAGAAADLLSVGSDYAKLDETKGVGKYVDKAEDYLHEYQNKSHSIPDGSNPPPHPDAHEPKPTKKEEHPVGGEPESGSGIGGYFKMAEGFLK